MTEKRRKKNHKSKSDKSGDNHSHKSNKSRKKKKHHKKNRDESSLSEPLIDNVPYIADDPPSLQENKCQDFFVSNHQKIVQKINLHGFRLV